MLGVRRLPMMVAAGALGGGGAATWSGPYDTFIASLAHVYEPGRRTLTAYTGDLVRLRRASDDAEADFGYVAATGELDTAAIATWSGGASYVVTVYDQAGSDNVTQAAEANQPLFTASAQNGHAGMTFDGTDDYLQGAYTNGGALSQPFSVFAVAKSSVMGYLMDGNDSVNRMILGADGNDLRRAQAGSWLSAVAGWPTDAQVWSVLFNGASSGVWLNTASVASGDAGTNIQDGITVGAKYDGSDYYWNGPITSIVICDPALSDADRIAMQTALNTYWSVY